MIRKLFFLPPRSPPKGGAHFERKSAACFLNIVKGLVRLSAILLQYEKAQIEVLCKPALRRLF